MNRYRTCKKFLTRFNLISFTNGITDWVTLCCKKCETHSTANDECVNPFLKSFDHANFVAHFCATENSNKRAFWFLA
jgi:hypothetical protein